YLASIARGPPGPHFHEFTVVPISAAVIATPPAFNGLNWKVLSAAPFKSVALVVVTVITPVSEVSTKAVYLVDGVPSTVTGSGFGTASVGSGVLVVGGVPTSHPQVFAPGRAEAD